MNDFRDRIVEEAAAWLARLQDCAVSAADRAAFAEWLCASPEHVHEYLALATLHADLAELPGAASLDELVRLAARVQNANVIDLRVAPPEARAAEPGPSRRRFLAFAASVVLMLLAAVWWLSSDANTAVYTTAIGEQKSFTLPDGSVVMLNAVSKVQLKYTEGFRDIHLLSGEALFDVAKNPHRPFRVLTGDSVIRAVGTRFNVYHRYADTTVTVVEGTVEIQRVEPSVELTPAAAEPVRVTRNQRARIDNASEAIAVRPANAAADTAWRERRLVFESRPLSEVIAEFNLYNEARLVIDPALSDIEVSGSFYANDPQSFALFLAEANIARTRIEADAIHLMPPAEVFAATPEAAAP